MINKEKFAQTYIHFDRETVLEIIDIFIIEYDDRIKKISHQLTTKNLPELHKSTHAFKGVIGNFETECESYLEISSIENDSRIFLEDMKNGKAGTQEGLDQLFENFEGVFSTFKKHSRQMLLELKEIKKNYVD